MSSISFLAIPSSFLYRNCSLIKYKIDLLRVYEKRVGNKNIDSLLIFWENKIRKNLKGFSKHQVILTLIDDMDRIFENLEEKKNKRNKKKLQLNLDLEDKDEYISCKTEVNFSNFKIPSKPVEAKPNPLRKSIFSDISATGPMFVTPSSKNAEAFQSLSPLKYMIYGTEERENQKEEHEIYSNRLNSSKNVNRFEFHTYNNNEDEEGNNINLLKIPSQILSDYVNSSVGKASYFQNINSDGYDARKRAQYDANGDGKIDANDSSIISGTYKAFYEKYGTCDEIKTFENY